MAVFLPSLSVCFRTKTPVNFTLNSNPNPLVSDFMKIGNDRRGIRVCSRIKELEPVILSEMATAVKRSKEEEERRSYYVNIGDAIRTLREEFPEIFYRELSFDIYRDDVVFKDPINTFFGIENYKSILSALRFHGRIFFKALWVDVVSVWQPVENTIMIRWTVHGIPRIPWESRGRFDGTSEYKLDKQGKIYEHRVHNIVLNAPPRFRVLSVDVDDLILSLGCPSTPKPTYFEISTPSTTWTSRYLASLKIKLESSSQS